MSQIWDVPDTPVGWTAQGCDQSDLVRCQVRFCLDVVRAEKLADHMQLTHGVVVRPEEDGAVPQ